MEKFHQVCSIFVLAVSLFSAAALGLEVLEPGYAVETYATFDTPETRPPVGMAFGPNGNLYVTSYLDTTYDGWIYRIEPDGSVVQWVDGLTRSRGIIWSSGEGYGDYFYLAEGWGDYDGSNGGVARVDLDGNISKFSGAGMNRPLCLEIDRTGNYGGYIYVSSSNWDRINKVLPTGEVQLFYSFTGSTSGSSGGIAFDPADSYGGLMYVAAQYGSNPELSGILTFDPNGNPDKFAPDIAKALRLAFDTTEQKSFGGYLYVVGMEPEGIFRVYPNGDIEEFIAFADMIVTIVFGPDGALYVMEAAWGTTTVTITRITFSPYLAAVAGIEDAIAEKRVALGIVEFAIDRELSALEALDLLEQSDSLEDWGLNRSDILKARSRVFVALNHQENIKSDLIKSIRELESALENLNAAPQEDE